MAIQAVVLVTADGKSTSDDYAHEGDQQRRLKELQQCELGVALLAGSCSLSQASWQAIRYQPAEWRGLGHHELGGVRALRSIRDGKDRGRTEKKDRPGLRVDFRVDLVYNLV